MAVIEIARWRLVVAGLLLAPALAGDGDASGGVGQATRPAAAADVRRSAPIWRAGTRRRNDNYQRRGAMVRGGAARPTRNRPS